MTGALCEPRREELLRPLKEKESAFNGANCLSCHYSMDKANPGTPRIALICYKDPQRRRVEDDHWCGEHPEIKGVMKCLRDTDHAKEEKHPRIAKADTAPSPEK